MEKTATMSQLKKNIDRFLNWDLHMFIYMEEVCLNGY